MPTSGVHRMWPGGAGCCWEPGPCWPVRRGTRGGWRRLDESRVSFTVTGGDLADVLQELSAVEIDEAA